MRRVLVPLDGSKLAEAIFPDALRLAGPGGGLILVREARTPEAVAAAEKYLAELADIMKKVGIPTRVELLTVPDAAQAIDEAAETLGADMIAFATHGRGPMGRLFRGGIAWRATAQSSVPVLLRHPKEDSPFQSVPPGARRIMVPLDGSAYAEKALPLADELALQWEASLWLVQVVPNRFAYAAAYADAQAFQELCDGEAKEARCYLDRIATALTGEVHTRVSLGTIVDCLVGSVDALGITDVVMASHGRTGLPRVIVGSVADALVHNLHCPVIVVPALAPGRLEDRPATSWNLDEIVSRPVDLATPGQERG
jgi:nucleotide-binding universal stress UspA family protein